MHYNKFGSDAGNREVEKRSVGTIGMWDIGTVEMRSLGTIVMWAIGTVEIISVGTVLIWAIGRLI